MPKTPKPAKVDEKEVRAAVMKEMARRRNKDPGDASPAKQKRLLEQARQADMDKKMQEAAAKPQKERGYYKRGGKVMPKVKPKMARKKRS